MIHSITVTNYLGNSITMDLTRPEDSGFVVQSVDGLGPAKATINTSEMATNDGSIFNSARLDERNIVLNLLFMDSSGESIEDIRRKTYTYFPLKKKLTFTVETDSISMEIEGYVESNEPTIFSNTEGCQISIICPYPYFWSASNSVTTFSTMEAAFEFPFSNECVADLWDTSNILADSDEELITDSYDGYICDDGYISSSSVSSIATIIMGIIEYQSERLITYEGDAEVGVTITIHALGTVSDLTIYNLDTGESMIIDTDKLEDLTGSGIVHGDDIVICTVKGSKSATLIRDGESINILNCIDRSSDWFQLAMGDNIFAYTAETGNTNLQFSVENRVIYEGV